MLHHLKLSGNLEVFLAVVDHASKVDAVALVSVSDFLEVTVEVVLRGLVGEFEGHFGFIELG